MGAVFALFAGFYFWAPKIIGKTYNELLGKIHFWTLFVGVLQTVIIIQLNSILNSKSSINVGDLTDRELLDIDSNDIDNNSLEDVLNKIPTGNTPNPNNPNNKKILEKLSDIQAEVKFIDIKKSKTEILLNIKNKSGIYMFFNLLNGNAYVGSSVKLDRRFRVHMSCIDSVNLPLYNALNKYGINNFVFIILQYCERDEAVCLGLEKNYLDLFKPKYNILKLAGSSQGFKHSPKAIAKLKKIHAGKLHPRFGKKS